MSYNSTFPLHDTNLSSLYYYATNPAGKSAQQHRTASPAVASDAPLAAADRDSFSAHASPTPAHFSPLPRSRNASFSQLGWPPSARGTPLSHSNSDAAPFGARGAFAGTPAAGATPVGEPSSLNQGFCGLQGYASGGSGVPPAAGTPDIPNSGLHTGYLGAAKLPGSDAFNAPFGGLNGLNGGGMNSGLSSGLNGGLNTGLGGMGGFGGLAGANGTGSDASFTGSLNGSLNGAHVAGVKDLSSHVSSATQSPIGAAAAPGFGAPGLGSLPVMTNWVYLDLSNTLQGPFPALQMSEWVAYFTDNVMLKREHDAEFVPFGVLKEVTGSSSPFAVPLSDETWAAVVRAAHGPAVPPPPGGAEPPAAAAPASQQASPRSREASLAPSTPRSSGARTVESSLADLNLSEAEPREGRERNPLSYQPAAPGSMGFENTQDTQAVLDESSFQIKPAQQRASLTASAAPGSGSMKDEPLRPKAVAPAAVKNEPARSKAAAAPGSGAPRQRSAPQSPVPSSPMPPAPAHATPAKAPPVSQQPASAVKRDDEPVTEPWRKPSLQAVSLAELKQREMEKQKKLNESPGPRKVQAKSWTQLPLGDESAAGRAGPAAAAKPGNSGAGTPMSWNLAAPAVAPKSLAEIQKEAQAKKVQAKPTYSSAVGHTGSGSTSQASASVASPYNGRFSALSEQAHPRAKQPQPQPQPQAAAPRAARAQPAAKPASVTAAASQAKPTDELIQWAKISFKGLSKEVNPMELLDVFLSLPSNNEAKEFIAESIYSYSKTLDGRRFAHDFLSRKKQAEQSMKPGETWQDVLKRFNPTVEQDPSFQVVTNKRVKPLARPEGMRA